MGLLDCSVMKPVRSFASDNNAVVHPEVLDAMKRANEGHVVGYGDDLHTQSAIGKFREHFGEDVEVFFVFNGTAANVLSLQALARPYHAVLCPELSHIYTDECGAPEKLTGCKLIPLPAPDGKLTVETAAHACHGIGDQHHVQPRVISITQSTEMGTVYKPGEIQSLANFATSARCSCTWMERGFRTPSPRKARRCGRRHATWVSMCCRSAEQKMDLWEWRRWSSSVRNLPRFSFHAQTGNATGVKNALHGRADGGSSYQ